LAVSTKARSRSTTSPAPSKPARCDNDGTGNDGTGNDGFDDTGNHRPRYPENGTHFTRAQRITDLLGLRPPDEARTYNGAPS
jgi:hypothetical protein